MDDQVGTIDYRPAIARTAELVAELCRANGDLEVLGRSYAVMRPEVAAAGYDLMEFLPDADPGTLHFNMPDFGRRFLNSYIGIVRAELCAKGSELETRVRNAITAGASSVISMLAAVLSVPTAAALVLAPIAALLLAYGLDVFCKMEVSGVSGCGSSGAGA
jgi:hypothetical protein